MLTMRGLGLSVLVLATRLAVASPFVDEAAEHRLLNRINRARAAVGLKILTPDSSLTDLARYHSADMAYSQFVSTESPRKGALSSRAAELLSLDENQVTALASVGTDVDRVTSSLMDPGLVQVGVGVAREGGRTFVTQIAAAPHETPNDAPVAISVSTSRALRVAVSSGFFNLQFVVRRFFRAAAAVRVSVVQ